MASSFFIGDMLVITSNLCIFLVLFFKFFYTIHSVHVNPTPFTNWFVVIFFLNFMRSHDSKIVVKFQNICKCFFFCPCKESFSLLEEKERKKSKPSVWMHFSQDIFTECTYVCVWAEANKRAHAHESHNCFVIYAEQYFYLINFGMELWITHWIITIAITIFRFCLHYALYSILDGVVVVFIAAIFFQSTYNVNAVRYYFISNI